MFVFGWIIRNVLAKLCNMFLLSKIIFIVLPSPVVFWIKFRKYELLLLIQAEINLNTYVIEAKCRSDLNSTSSYRTRCQWEREQTRGAEPLAEDRPEWAEGTRNNGTRTTIRASVRAGNFPERETPSGVGCWKSWDVKCDPDQRSEVLETCCCLNFWKQETVW